MEKTNTAGKKAGANRANQEKNQKTKAAAAKPTKKTGR